MAFQFTASSYTPCSFSIIIEIEDICIMRLMHYALHYRTISKAKIEKLVTYPNRTATCLNM